MLYFCLLVGIEPHIIFDSTLLLYKKEKDVAIKDVKKDLWHGYEGIFNADAFSTPYSQSTLLDIVLSFSITAI